MNVNAQIDKSLEQIIKENRQMRPKKTTKPKAKSAPRRSKNKGADPNAMQVDSFAGRLGSSSKTSRVIGAGRLAGRVGKADISRRVGKAGAGGRLAGISERQRRVEEKPKPRLNISIKGEAGPATVFISNLDTEASPEDVKTCFKQFGAIKACTLLYDHNGKASGHAEVTYSTKVAAEEAAAKLNNALADGRRLTVRLMPQTASQTQNLAPFAASALGASRKPRKHRRAGGRMDLD
ncbi:hypothetical protein LPJ63_000325 [Coemansia sp. RSA 2711]|nr:hypothetical protein LPJ63_000325 [Coemansia sp. RSA 2711]